MYYDRSRQEEHTVVDETISLTSPADSRTPQSTEAEDLTRSALPTFYRSKINTTLPVPPTSRLAYIGTSASNLAHLVNNRTTRPDCLHYPFPPYRSTLPWKPSASSSTARAIPVPQPQSNAHEPPQWTFTTLPDPDLGVLPVSEIREELIDAYFTHVHPGFPIIQEAEFRRRLKAAGGNSKDTFSQEPPALLLLQCVLLVGAHVSTHPTIENARSSIKEALYRRVRSLFDMRYENDRLFLLQAALLLTWHIDSADDVSANAWYWSGIASRIALGLGLHRRFTSTNLRPEGQRRMRCMWWLVVQTEVLCALSHGRPVNFDLDDCDQNMLSKDDLTEEDFDLTTGACETVCTANVSFCLANVSLCLILWDILKLNSPGAKRRLGGENSTAMREAEMNLNACLAKWCMQLPPDMANPGRPAQSFWAAQLHLHYYTAVITLNRQLKVQTPDSDPGYGSTAFSTTRQSDQDLSALSNDVTAYTSHGSGNNSDAECRSLCHASAVSILSTLNRVVDLDWTRRCWHSTLTSVLAAAIQFSSEVQSANHSNGTNSEPDTVQIPLQTRHRSSPLSKKSASSSVLLFALGSLDRLLVLASISSQLTSYWSPAEGLSRLIETISAELRGIISDMAAVRDQGIEGNDGTADANANSTDRDVRMRDTPLSRTSTTEARRASTTIHDTSQIFHEPSNVESRRQPNGSAQSQTEWPAAAVHRAGASAEDNETMDSDAMRRTIGLSNSLHFNADRVHANQVTRNNPHNGANESDRNHNTGSNDSNMALGSSGDMTSFGHESSIWERRPVWRNPGSDSTADHASRDIDRGISRNTAENSMRERYPSPAATGQSDPTDLSAHQHHPSSSQRYPSHSHHQMHARHHSTQSYPLHQQQQPEPYMTVGGREHFNGAGGGGGPWELQIEDLFRYMTDPVIL